MFASIDGGVAWLCAAMGTTQDCRRQIHRELRYQSSMDLDAGTYAAIRCEREETVWPCITLSRQTLVWTCSHSAARHTPTCLCCDTERATAARLLGSISGLMRSTKGACSCPAYVICPSILLAKVRGSLSDGAPKAGCSGSHLGDAVAHFASWVTWRASQSCAGSAPSSTACLRGACRGRCLCGSPIFVK